ncbi:MAG: prepilin peptidase [Phycisphaerales bacterium]
METLAALSPWIATALALVAAGIDVRTREIPDWIPISIAVWALGSMIGGFPPYPLDWVSVLLGGVIGLAVGWAAFALLGFGGGDAKLVAAIGLTVGPAGLLQVLCGSAILGGAIAIGVAAFGGRAFAYGPAIALSLLGLTVLWVIQPF